MSRSSPWRDPEIGVRRSKIGNLSDAKRIAIFRLSALGDVINTLPALSALRRARPDAHITWIVEAASAGVLEGHPMLDEVLVSGRKTWEGAFKRRHGWWRATREFVSFCSLLGKKQIDAVIDFQGNLRSAVGVRLTRAPLRIGPARGSGREFCHLFYTRRVDLPPGPMHRVERGLRLLEGAGVPTADAKPVIPVTKEDITKVDAFLASVGLASPQQACHSELGGEPFKGADDANGVDSGTRTGFPERCFADAQHDRGVTGQSPPVIPSDSEGPLKGVDDTKGAGQRVGVVSPERCFARLSMTEGGGSDKLSMTRGSGFAVIHAGTSPFGQYKQWPTERWVETAKRLAMELGLRVVFSRGPSQSESEASEAMASAVGEGALVAPLFSLRELGELCRRCRVFLSVDTGPMHLASAVGAPVVALFGPKDPAVYGPYFGPRAIVEKPLECRPCRKRSCDDPRCMHAITPDDVVDATEGLLSRGMRG